MAETYELVCDQCRVRVWVGQDHVGHREKFYLYGGGRAVPNGAAHLQQFSPAARFLIDHEGHPLRFCGLNRRPAELDDYAELDEEDVCLAPKPATLDAFFGKTVLTGDPFSFVPSQNSREFASTADPEVTHGGSRPSRGASPRAIALFRAFAILCTALIGLFGWLWTRRTW